jgi:hypothetical protein
MNIRAWNAAENDTCLAQAVLITANVVIPAGLYKMNYRTSRHTPQVVPPQKKKKNWHRSPVSQGKGVK